MSANGFSNRHTAVWHTFLELLDEVVDNLLQLGAVHREEVLELLDLLQEILRHIGHGSWLTLSARSPHFERGVDNLPLREGGRRGPIPTMVTRTELSGVSTEEEKEAD